MLAPIEVTVNPAPAATAAQTQAGRDRYNAGEQIAACTSAYERMGWLLALRDEADATTDAYLSMAGGRS